MAASVLIVDSAFVIEPWSAGGVTVPAPTNLRQTASTSSTLTLAWDGVAGTQTLQRATVTNGTVGAYSQVYSNTAKTTTDGPLAFGASYAYRVKVTVNGVDSPYSNVLQYTAASKPKLLLFDDDSLGSYYYQANGTWVKPAPSFQGAPNPQQFSGKVAGVSTTPNALFINNSYPGFNLIDATTNGPSPSDPTQNVVAAKQQVFTSYGSNYDIDVAVGFLENSFESSTLAQVKAQFDAYNAQTFAMGAKRIFWRPGTNRAGTHSGSADGDYWTQLVAMRAYMRQQAAASNGAVVVLADADGPNISAQGYPQNGQVCNQNDGGMFVHFTEFGVTEQANQLIKTIDDYGYTFSGLAVSVGTGGVSTGTPVTDASWAVQRDATTSGRTVTSAAGLTSFSGLATTQQKLSGNGTLRAIVRSISGATGGLVGITTQKTSVASPAGNHLQEALYFDIDLERHAYELGIKLSQLSPQAVLGVVVDFILTDSPTDVNKQLCEVKVGSERLLLREVPRAQYALGVALASDIQIDGYYVSGTMVAN